MNKSNLAGINKKFIRLFNNQLASDFLFFIKIIATWIPPSQPSPKGEGVGKLFFTKALLIFPQRGRSR